MESVLISLRAGADGVADVEGDDEGQWRTMAGKTAGTSSFPGAPGGVYRDSGACHVLVL
jgi:hypothetical protein